MKQALTSKERLEEDIQNHLINEEDGPLAQEFINIYAAKKQLSEGSKKKYFYALSAFLKELQARGHSMQSLNEQGALDMINYVRTSKWSEDTRSDYWDRFTRFYKWGYKRQKDWNEEAYELLAGEEKIVYRIDRNKVQRKGTFTQDQMLQIIEAECNLCYKVFFSVLFEAGLRSDEILSLQIRDVETNEEGIYVIHLRRSKTIRRSVPLESFSAEYMRKWLSQHPDKDNKQAILFANTLGRPLSNASANKQLKFLNRVTGLNIEKISLHSLRHSRSTHLSEYMTDAQRCKFFGWAFGSRQVQTYTRRDKVDLIKPLREAAGKSEEAPEPDKAGIPCLHCKHRNSSEAKFCDICNLPLDAEKLSAIKNRVGMVKKEEMLKDFLRKERSDIIKEVKESLLQEISS